MSSKETTSNDTVKARDDVDGGPKISFGPNGKPKDSPKTDVWAAIASFQRDNAKLKPITTNSKPIFFGNIICYSSMTQLFYHFLNLDRLLQLGFGQTPPHQQQEQRKLPQKSAASLFGRLSLETPPKSPLFDQTLKTSKGIHIFYPFFNIDQISN